MSALLMSLDETMLKVLNNLQSSNFLNFYTHARRNQLLFANRQRGIFRLHVGCAKHTVDLRYFFVLFRKDLVRMNGIPQPNQNDCRRWELSLDLSITSLNP